MIKETIILTDLENIPKLDLIEFDDKITIEVFVETKIKVAESIIPMVSKWKHSSSFNSFEAFDAHGIDGLNSSGYFGAIFDGRYVYFSPEQHSTVKKGDPYSMPGHGIVLRYDTYADFKNSKSYSAYDAGNTNGLETKGYYGAAFDGRYVYFVPRQLGNKYHSRILRHDTKDEFKNTYSWDAFDIEEPHSSQGAAFDGRYVYLCPGFSGNPLKEDRLSSRIIRYDTRANFKEKKSYEVADISEFFGPKAGCFDGAGFDGRYIYFVPLQTKTVVRYDTLNGFNDDSSWQIFNGENVGMGMSVGVVFDGHFMYFVPYKNSNVIRFDTRKDFTNPLSWSTYNASMTNGLETGGFDGGFFDGRYLYFVPFVKKIKNSGIITMHTNFLRYDPFGDFKKSSSWTAFDASKTSGLSTLGYNAGAFDGRYFYAAPWIDNAERLGEGVHSRILRYDTVGENGSFSLNYCDYGHNGGLCAALRGPSFIINTEHGVRSVVHNKTLDQGMHHIVGTYDNKHLKLYIDGSMVAKRKCNGKIQRSNAPVAVAKFSGLKHLAQGKIHNVRISKIARSSEYINITYRNIIKTGDFIEYM